MTKRRGLLRIILMLVLLAACGDGASDVDAPPTIEITMEPEDGLVGTATTIGFAVTDDRGLQVVSVGWGTFGAPVEIFRPSDRTFAATRSHTYAEAGVYAVSVQATDTSGRMNAVSRSVTIQSAPAAARR